MAYEYDHDWTLDPDYGDEGFHFSEFEEDGAPIASDAQLCGLRVHMLNTARNRIGYRTTACHRNHAAPVGCLVGRVLPLLAIPWKSILCGFLPAFKAWRYRYQASNIWPMLMMAFSDAFRERTADQGNSIFLTVLNCFPGSASNTTRRTQWRP